MNSYDCVSFFLINVPFILFLCLLGIASTTMVNSLGDIEYLCFPPNLRHKTSCFPFLRLMSAVVSFSLQIFIKSRQFSIPSFLRAFYYVHHCMLGFVKIYFLQLLIILLTFFLFRVLIW